MLRGYCMASLPPGGLVPVTAFFAALGGGLVLRSVFDLFNPIPIGDWQESPRHLLQWGLVIGLAVLFGFGLVHFAGRWIVPQPDQFGPSLRSCLGFDGALLAVRSVLRSLIWFFRRPAEATRVIPELAARMPVHESEPLPPMRELEMAEPDRGFWLRSNVPGLVIGLALFAIAVAGWNMSSLCLFRLPQ